MTSHTSKNLPYPIAPKPRIMSLLKSLRIQEASMRVQDPTIMQTEGENPQYYIRPYIDTLDDNGEMIRVQKAIYLGRIGEVSKRDAIRKKTEVMGKINKSQFTVVSSVRVGEFLDTFEREYINGDVLGESENTGKQYESLIKTWIRPAFGNMLMGEVDALAVTGLMKQMTVKGKSQGLRTNVKQLISKIWNQARAWQVYKGENPAEFAIVGRSNKRPREIGKLSTEQLIRLLSCMDEELRVICMTALLTLSISEIMGLQWKHIDFVGKVIHVRQAKHRNGKVTETKAKDRVRDIPMGDLSVVIADMFPTTSFCGDDFVFVVITKSGKISTSILEARRLLIDAAKKAGVYQKGFGFHVFRREAITEIGGIIGDLQANRMAGHSRMNMTYRYTKGDNVLQERAVREIQERVKVVSIRKGVA